jgi:hypothetical protein
LRPGRILLLQLLHFLVIFATLSIRKLQESKMRNKKNLNSAWLEVDPPKKESRAEEQFWDEFEAEWEKGIKAIQERRKSQKKIIHNENKKKQ